MTPEEKDALYKEFRKRFLTDLCGRIAVDEGDIFNILRRWQRRLELDNVVRSPMVPHRMCGFCGRADIPYGVDWQFWYEGTPVHESCLMMNRQPR